MVDWILIAIGIVLLALIAWTVIFILRRRKKKKKTLVIPPDVLEDFETAERRLKQSHGEKNPYTILYEISRERADRENRPAYVPKPAAFSPSVYEPIQRGQMVQNDAGSVYRQQHSSAERARPSRKRSLFGRRTRRRKEISEYE